MNLNQPNKNKSVPNSSNSNHDNETWECNICHKIFKQKKAYNQHINSNTHQPIKHSCNLCGKGFASLGALALHNEQASHAHLNKNVSSAESLEINSNHMSTNPSHSVQLPRMTTSNHNPNYGFRPAPSSYEMNSQSGQYTQAIYPNNGASGFAKNTQVNYGSPDIRNFNNKNMMTSNNHYNRNYPSQQPLYAPSTSSTVYPMQSASISEYGLHVGGSIDAESGVGAFGWIVTDDTHDTVIFQHAVSFVDCQWTVEQLEYQALIHGFKAAHSKGMTTIKVKICSDLIISHLLNDKTSNVLDATKYHELESFKAEVLPLLQLFQEITFEKTLNTQEYVELIVKKTISDCIARLTSSGYYTAKSPTIFNQQVSSMWSQPELFPSTADEGESPFLFGIFGKESAGSRMNKNVGMSNDTSNSLLKTTGESSSDLSSVSDEGLPPGLQQFSEMSFN